IAVADVGIRDGRVAIEATRRAGIFRVYQLDHGAPTAAVLILQRPALGLEKGGGEILEVLVGWHLRHEALPRERLDQDAASASSCGGSIDVLRHENLLGSFRDAFCLYQCGGTRCRSHWPAGAARAAAEAAGYPRPAEGGVRRGPVPCRPHPPLQKHLLA